jgi:lysine biosynthesis protein LysW
MEITMAIEKRESFLSADCPLCAAPISLPQDTEESEIFRCPLCQSMLVVDSCSGRSLSLTQAPQIEEDWGE